MPIKEPEPTQLSLASDPPYNEASVEVAINGGSIKMGTLRSANDRYNSRAVSNAHISSLHSHSIGTLQTTHITDPLNATIQAEGDKLTWKAPSGRTVFEIDGRTGEVVYEEDLDFVSQLFWKAINASTDRLAPKKEMDKHMRQLVEQNNALVEELHTLKEDHRKTRNLLGTVMKELKRTYKEEESMNDGRIDEV